MLLAYFVRPLIQEVAGSPYLRLVMTDEELAAGESRKFSENSARWLGWYLGPLAVLLGSLGWALTTRRLLAGKSRLITPFLLVFSAMSVLYLWKPSINPDQIWAMRRFLPVTIPGFLVLAGVALEELWSRTDRVAVPVLAKSGVAVAAAAVVAGALIPFAPLADLHEFDGLANDVSRSCETMGEDAAVLFLDGPEGTAGSRLAPSYRGFCGLPSAYTTSRDPALIESLRVSWEAQGRRLWLLAVGTTDLEALDAGPVQPLIVAEYEILELTFTRRPTDTAPFGIGIYGVPAPTG
jgi:hypothetical protein